MARKFPATEVNPAEILARIWNEWRVKMIDTEKLYTTLSQGKMDGIEKLVQEALEMGESAESILRGGLIPAMDRIGIKFKRGEIYIPEVLIAATAMHAGMTVL